MEENKINFIIKDEKEVSQETPVSANIQVKQQEIMPKVEHKFSNFVDAKTEQKNSFKIKVVGIGGAGCNVITYINNNCKNVSDVAELYALNTDIGSLELAKGVKNKFLLNKEELKGYGSGSDPEVGRQAVIHDSEIIKNEFRGTDILFVIAGLGKGAGSGGAPELAKIAKELGILTVAIVNVPSITCEGNVICNNASSALQSLSCYADSITTISNERIVNNKHNMSFFEAYDLANDQIARIIEDIVTIIYKPTAMNIDFADLRTFFKKNKFFMMGRVGYDATNINEVTIKNALISKIKSSFTDINIDKAKSAICNICMSKKTPTTFVQNINRALGEYTNNTFISMSTGIDYNDSNRIDVSFLVAGNNATSNFDVEISSDVEEAKWHEPTVQIDASSKDTDDEYKDFLKGIEEASLSTKDLKS